MLLLFSNPGSGLSLALEAGISAGESADLIDVDRERAVRFVDDPVISHAFKYGMRSGVRKPAARVVGIPGWPPASDFADPVSATSDPWLKGIGTDVR